MSEGTKDTASIDPENEKKMHAHKEHSHHHHHHHHKNRTKKEKLKKFFGKHKMAIAIAVSAICVILMAVVLIVDNIHNTQSELPPIDNFADDMVGSNNNRNPNAPLYSFGVLSDVHLQYGEGKSGGVADFRRALTYLRDRTSFTCVVGDMVDHTGVGEKEYFGTYD